MRKHRFGTFRMVFRRMHPAAARAAQHHRAQRWRGVSPVELVLDWGGDERGSDSVGPRRDFPICRPVSSQAPHAVGVDLAMKLKGERRVAVCCLGDGGTAKGDFYESINL